MANKPIDKDYLVASLKSFDEEVLSKKYNNSTGGSENTIESISVNGNTLTPDKNKNIDIIIPDISELEDNSHSHLNKETLDKFSESDEGKLLFDGSEIEGGAGTQGENGITPHIGDNGNWYIGEEDTGVTATGKDGENVTIAKIEPIVGGNRVTFSWYDDNDTQQSSSIEIMNGKDAVSIASARVENGNELILGLSDGTELDPVTITIDSSNVSLDGYYSATEIDTLLANQKTELTEYIDEKVTETVDDKVDTATEEDIKNLF